MTVVIHGVLPIVVLVQDPSVHLEAGTTCRPRVHNSPTALQKDVAPPPDFIHQAGPSDVLRRWRPAEAGWRERVGQHQASLKEVTRHDGLHQRKYRATSPAPSAPCRQGNVVDTLRTVPQSR
jgi:hypothetical protein